MKSIISILLLSVTFGLIMECHAGERYAYVKKSNVNVRATPSSSGNVLEKAQEGDMLWVTDIVDGWVAFVYNEMEEEIAYISKSMVDIFDSQPITIDLSDATFSFHEGDTVGFLNFTKKDNEVEYKYVFKSTSLVNQGGSGIIDSGQGVVNYVDHILYQPSEWFMGRSNNGGVPEALYDSNNGKLFFGGFIWNENK